jgi:hypothetical protein
MTTTSEPNWPRMGRTLIQRMVRYEGSGTSRGATATPMEICTAVRAVMASARAVTAAGARTCNLRQ